MNRWNSMVTMWEIVLVIALTEEIQVWARPPGMFSVFEPMEKYAAYKAGGFRPRILADEGYIRLVH